MPCRPTRQAARRTGAEVIVVPNDEHGQLDVAALERLAGDGRRSSGCPTYPPAAAGPARRTDRPDRPRLRRAVSARCYQSVGQFPVNVDHDRLRPADRHRPASSCAARGAPGSCGCAPPRWRSSIRPSPRSARRPGTDIRASPGPTRTAGSTPGNTALSTCGLGTAVRRALGLGLARDRAARHPLGAPGSAASSPSCPALPFTTLAGPAAPSSPARSTIARSSRRLRTWAAPGSTFPPAVAKASRWTPKTGASTR